jgi:hypothetical protein
MYHERIWEHSVIMDVLKSAVCTSTDFVPFLQKLCYQHFVLVGLSVRTLAKLRISERGWAYCVISVTLHRFSDEFDFNCY